MSHTPATEIEKIRSTMSSLEDTEKALVAGSDEHLDLILDIRNALARNTADTKLLVEYIESNFNNYTVEAARILIAKVSPYFDLAKKVIEAAKESGICNDIKGHVAEFEAEVNELFEITDDLSKYKVGDSNDYTSLFND